MTVARSYVMTLSMARAEASQNRTFVRLVTCPTKHERFQVTLKLSETANNKIDSVTVGEARPVEQRH